MFLFVSAKTIKTNLFKEQRRFSTHFSVNIFIFYGCYLFLLNCTIDFQFDSLDIARYFAIYTMGLQTDGRSYGWADQWIDGAMDGQTYPLLQMP